MICVPLTAADLLRVRFAADPVWETVAAFCALRAGRGYPPHARLRERVGLVDRRDLELLSLLTVHPVWLPRVLTPAPTGRCQDPGARLAEVPRVGRALLGFWSAVLEPVWERVEAIVAADVAERGTALARGGAAAVLGGLHPDVALHGESLQIKLPGSEHAIRPSGAGIWLVPSVFRWPGVAMSRSGPLVLSYPAAGSALVWAPEPARPGEPMVALVGRSRATILAQLDVPRSTTSLATRLELSAGTVSEHLAVLTQAGLLTARRDGRRVLYAQTPLGARLLASVHEAAAEQDVAG